MESVVVLDVFHDLWFAALATWVICISHLKPLFQFQKIIECKLLFSILLTIKYYNKNINSKKNIYIQQQNTS